jgi:hypothetical protein
VRFSFDVGQAIAAEPTRVWDLVSDTTRWPEWNLVIAAVECDDQHVKLGSEGRVQTPVGMWLPFKITSFDEGHLWGWRVMGIPATGHRIERLAGQPGSAYARVSIPFVSAAYAPVAQLTLRRLEKLAVDKFLEPD